MASRRAAVTLLETLVVLAVTSFLLASTGMLFQSLLRQQELARNVGSGEDALAEALRVMARVVRHAEAVVVESDRFGSEATRSDRITVLVPEPSGAAQERMEILFHVSGGTLYKCRADQPDPGLAIASGVAGLAVESAVRFESLRQLLPATVEGRALTRADSSEVVLTVWLDRGRQRLRQSVAVTLRNRRGGE